MSYFRQNLSRPAKAIPPSEQNFTFPASVRGVNAYSSLMQMDPAECLYTYNLMPSEYGLRLRKGFREWAINCVENPPRGENSDVRTIIPFESKIESVANDRLFAATPEGIWNVTSYNAQAPAQEVTFPITTGKSGWGVWTEFTGDAAGEDARGRYLFYADGANGLWQYEEATSVWEQPVGGIEDFEWYSVVIGGDPDDPTDRVAFPVEDIAYVMVHKQRIWVILEDDDDAWYLPVAAISGRLTRFTFGSKLPRGGNLVGLWTWSIDGGDGVDDYMVAIGRGGDVVIYRGEDPELDFATNGTWFIGEVPDSRRIVAEIGPQLYMLSTFGLSSLADLLKGVPPEYGTPSQSVNRFLRSDVERGKDSQQWQLTQHPADGFMQIVTPKPASTPYVQYTQNIQTQAWGFWQDVPAVCADTWNGDYFMGGPDGVVYINDGTRDGVQLPGPNFWQDVPVGTPGAEWSTPDTDEFAVDGTQTAQTEYVVTPVEDLQIGVEYEIFYKIKDWSAGQHSLKVGDEIVLPGSVANGIFVGRFTPTEIETTLAIVGDEDLVATFYEVTVRVNREDGEPIKFRTLTSFQAPQGHTKYTRVGLIRTVGILAGQANLNTNAVYDYRVEATIPQPPPLVLDRAGIWDSSLWDVDIWDYEMRGQNATGGALGMGRAFAVLMVGNATTRVNIVAWDISYTVGGYL